MPKTPIFARRRYEKVAVSQASWVYRQPYIYLIQTENISRACDRYEYAQDACDTRWFSPRRTAKFGVTSIFRCPRQFIYPRRSS